MRTKKNGPASDRVGELCAAIREIAVVRSSSGVRIAGTEGSTEERAWLIDLRAILMRPTWIDLYAEIFWERYADRLPFQVGALESAGIALMSAIVMKSVQRRTPVNGFYTRKSRKRYGLMKYIEGTLTDEPVILVDDLIHSGSSLLKQAEILESEGKNVVDAFVLAAFRDDAAYAPLTDKGIRLAHLFSLEDLGLAPQSENTSVGSAFEILWRFAAPAPSLQFVVQKSTPRVADDLLFFGDDQGTMCALETNSGTLRWEYAIGKHPSGKGIFSSPALARDLVTFGGYDGSVHALERKSGALRWRYDGADWIGSSPAVAEDLGLVFIGLEYGLVGKRGGIAALDMVSGKERWRMSHPSFTHGSPLYVQKESLVVIGSNNGVVYAYDAATGAQRWSVATRGDIKTAPGYDATHRALIVSSMDGVVYSLDARTGEVRAVFETGAAIYGAPLVADGRVYVASLDKCVYALSTDLKKLWSFETGGRVFSTPVVEDDSLWIGSNDGKLYELDAARGTERASHQFTERIVNPVVVDGDRMFVSTVANEIYCIKKQSQR